MRREPREPALVRRGVGAHAAILCAHQSPAPRIPRHAGPTRDLSQLADQSLHSQQREPRRCWARALESQRTLPTERQVDQRPEGLSPTSPPPLRHEPDLVRSLGVSADGAGDPELSIPPHGHRGRRGNGKPGRDQVRRIQADHRASVPVADPESDGPGNRSRKGGSEQVGQATRARPGQPHEQGEDRQQGGDRDPGGSRDGAHARWTGSRGNGYRNSVWTATPSSASSRRFRGSPPENPPSPPRARSR